MGRALGALLTVALLMTAWAVQYDAPPNRQPAIDLQQVARP